MENESKEVLFDPTTWSPDTRRSIGLLCLTVCLFLEVIVLVATDGVPTPKEPVFRR